MAETNENPYEILPFTNEQTAVLQKYFKETYCSDNGKFVYMGLPGQPKFAMNITYAESATDIYHLPIRATDVFVDTFPRSGTTWTQELVWLLANDLDFEKAKNISLTNRYYFLEIFLFFKNKVAELREKFKDDPGNLRSIDFLAKPTTEVMADMPSPRFIKSHLPVSLLPKDTLEKAKVVYVARDPRDVAVSYYHFSRANLMLGLKDIDFKTYYYEIFTKDLALWAPHLDHVKEAWELREHRNMLFIFYEELSKDLKGTCHRVSSFLGKQYSEQQLQQLADHLAFDNFQNNSAVDVQTFRNLGFMEKKKDNFVRKGKAGAWREYFDAEMCAHASRWMQHRLQDSDLKFLE